MVLGLLDELMEIYKKVLACHYLAARGIEAYASWYTFVVGKHLLFNVLMLDCLLIRRLY